MKTSPWLLALACLATACGPRPAPKPAAGDWRGLPDKPMDRVVAQLATESEIWLNGVVNPVGEPEDARLEMVLGRVFADYSAAGHRISQFKILETREMRIPESPYLGVYQVLKVETNLGPMIVLLQYTPDHTWWSRVIKG